MKTELVHKSKIQVGDCIIIDGVEKTVSRGDIKTGFMGRTIFGCPFRSGIDMVERRLFPKWYRGEIIGYYSQV